MDLIFGPSVEEGCQSRLASFTVVSKLNKLSLLGEASINTLVDTLYTISNNHVRQVYTDERAILLEQHTEDGKPETGRRI